MGIRRARRFATSLAVLAVVSVAVLAAGCGSSGSTSQGAASPSPSVSPTAAAITELQVTSLVDTTAAAMEEDAPGTLAAIDAGEAPFRNPSNPGLYAFVYDPGVKLIATPDDKVRGKEMRGVPDAAGKTFRDEIISGALEHGSGWEDYVYTEPGKEGLFSKSTYYELVTGSDGQKYIVCAGRYTGPVLPGTHKDTAATTAEVQLFVEKAVQYANDNGKEKALAAFTESGGAFHDGELYIFAYDFDGNVIAHGGQPDLVGKDLLDMEDPNGLPVIQELIKRAEAGSGWLAYQWPNPQNEQRIEPKLGYVMKVDDSWWLGSGTYGPSARLNEPKVTRSDVEAFVKKAAAYVKEQGKAAALKEFSDPNGAFRKGELYIYAEDFKGNELASGGQPELVGENILDVRDANGKYLVKALVRTAKTRGSGWVKYVWDDPQTNRQRDKLGYVIRVGADWYVGSGMYAD